MSKSIRRIGVVETGVIGASWSALFLAQGHDVVSTDPAPDAEKALREYIANAWPAMEPLNVVVSEGSQSRLTFTTDINRLVAGKRSTIDAIDRADAFYTALGKRRSGSTRRFRGTLRTDFRMYSFGRSCRSSARVYSA